MKLFKNYILFSLLLIVLFSSCSNNDVRVIDNESLLTKEEINFINCLDINRYNYLVFISNEYTPEKDYTAMSNEYIKLHNIKNRKLIMFYIGLDKHIINIQITNQVNKQISQNQLDKAVEIMSNNFKDNKFFKGIIESIEYLEKR